MKTFRNSELKTFEQLASLRQSSLKKVLASFLKKHYSKVVHTNEYLIAEGDIPVALTAHMDTVFNFPPDEIYFDSKKNVLWSPGGLGADDRAGVFAIVQIIRSGLRPHVIFTTDEEVGGKGAYALSKLDCPFNNLKYIIELDRRGSNDCVFYDCENQDFIDYVENFGFEYNFGSYSDICEFCPKWKVAGVNLSIGYRDEHSTSEVLFVGQMYSTIEKVKKMLEDAKNLTKPFVYIPSPNSWHTAYGMAWYDLGNGVYGHGVHKCHHCKKYYMEEELFPAVAQDKTTVYYCPDCAVEMAWCDECGNGYQKYSPEAPMHGLCPFCQEAKEKLNEVNQTNK